MSLSSRQSLSAVFLPNPLIFERSFMSSFIIANVKSEIFNPERIEHILIPQISTAIVTENEISKCSFNGKTYNIEDFCNSSILKKNKDEIDYSKNIFYEMTDKALELISNAHKIHDDLEAYYISSLDFNMLDDIYKDTINKLTRYI